MMRNAGQAQMNSAEPNLNNNGPAELMNSRKQKFMNQQQNQSPGGTGGKHKINMSVDNNGSNSLALGGVNGQTNSHSKHISMNGLPYDKMKGLTPVSNKSGAVAKNNLHM